MIGLSRIASRRNVVRGAVGLGLAGPFAVANQVSVLAQDKASADHSGHPAVGVWMLSAIPSAYLVFHADGTFEVYEPWVSKELSLGEPTLPAYGFGVWEPREGSMIEASCPVAWGDTSVTNRMTWKFQLTVDESGDHMAGQAKRRLMTAGGTVVLDGDIGGIRLARIRLEPFDEPVAPEATPGA